MFLIYICLFTGEGRVRFPVHFHCRVFYEDYRTRIHSASECLSSERVEYSRFYNSDDWVWHLDIFLCHAIVHLLQLFNLPKKANEENIFTFFDTVSAATKTKDTWDVKLCILCCTVILCLAKPRNIKKLL